jgi:2-dehydro-3-deoxygluconokinase
MSRIVTFGEIMLRLSTPDHLRLAQASRFDASYGGGEANVAVSLAQFGHTTEFVTRLPDNDLGRAALSSLRGCNVGTRHVVFGGDRLGIYFLETGAVNRPSNVLYDRADSSIASISVGEIDWDEVLAGASWFHWTGITPAVSRGAANVCRDAIRAAQRHGLTVSCDLNYRAKLWKYGDKPGEVMQSLVEDCDVVVANEEDAERVFGISAEGIDVTTGEIDTLNFESVARQLWQKFDRVKKVAITLRGSVSASHNTWSGLLWDGQRLYTAPTYEITHIVDRVGGGDAFAAGLIHGFTTYEDNQEALNFAVAASCLKHTIPGDFNLVTVKEVERLMQGDRSGRVLR